MNVDPAHTPVTPPSMEYAQLADYETSLLDADDALSIQLAAAIEAQDSDLCNDILDEKIAIEKKFQASREQTWLTWMAPYSGGRPAA